MHSAFIVIHLSLLVYFIRRRFDLITSAFYTSTVYFLPGYFGYTCYDVRDLQLDAISIELYAFYIAYYLLLLLCSLTVKAPAGDGEHGLGARLQNIAFGNERLSRFLVMLRYIVPAFLVIAQFLTPGGLWQDDKQALLSNVSVAYSVFENATYVYLVVAAVRRSRLDCLMAVTYCCIDLFVGFRTTAAFVFFSLVTLYAMQRREKSLLANCLIPFGIAAAFIFGSFYKSIVILYLAGGASAVTDYLEDPVALGASFYQNEAFSQQHIFNKVLETNFQVPWDYPLNMARLFSPGVANAIFGKNVSFNDYFQPVLYPEVPWGMASNIWAEQYSVGGIIWLYVFLIAFAVGLILVNRLAVRLSAAGKIDKFLLLAGIAVPALLYMHRNDLLYEFVLVRNMGLLLLAIGLLTRIRWGILRASSEARVSSCDI